MKLTSARKDYGIYGFMVAVFLAGTIAFFVRYGTSEIWYTLLMIAFLLLSLYFFSCTLRFRVMWVRKASVSGRTGNRKSTTPGRNWNKCTSKISASSCIWTARSTAFHRAVPIPWN